MTAWAKVILSVVAGVILLADHVTAAEPRAPQPPTDLSGVWTNRSLTRLERPAYIADLIVPEAQVPALEAKVLDLFVHPPDDTLGQFVSEWHDDARFARIDGVARSSWIVSPADGHVPYTAEGRHQLAARRAAMITAYDGPEVRTTSDRCLTPPWSALGPPMLNAPYAANYVIVQTPEFVAIQSEMNHEVRIVRLNQTHATAILPRWTGDSIGHWENNTLVVETIGFHPAEVFRSPPFLMGPDTRITERFTRVSPEEIRYEFKVEDPKMYTTAWRAEMPFRASKDVVYEYACHEGNYSMRGILAGARRVEADARAAAATKR